MLKRTITGIVFVAILLSAIIIHPGTFFILFLLLTFLGLYEFYKMAEKTEVHVQKKAGILIGLLVYSSLSSYYLFDFVQLKHLSLCLILPFLLFITELYRRSTMPIFNIGVSLMGIVYVAIPFALLSYLVVFDKSAMTGIYNPNILLGYLFLIWTSDTCAYLAGRSFGKRKLFNRISPKKTWEGAAGGFILSLILAYVLSIYFTSLTVQNWLIIAAIVVITGIFGDLTESMFKRSVGIKDSGVLLPGHGGILDRFDAVFISAPCIWVYLSIIN